MAVPVFIPNPLAGELVAAAPPMGVAMAAIAREVASTASDLAPVDTGNLAGSLEGEAVFEGGKWKARVSTDVPYSGFVEYGTSDTPMQPYLRPAADQVAS